MDDAISSILGTRVLTVPSRASRPGVLESPGGTCPFCPGEEEQTPPPLDVRPSLPAPWDVRVVPNLYPIFGDPLDRPLHEVVIETPDHHEAALQWSTARIERVFRVWLERLSGMNERSDVAMALAFRNEGAAGGASLDHPHSHVIGLPEIPQTLLDSTSDCRICAELQRRDLILATRGGLVAWCPDPSVTPWEIAIAPATHRAGFGMDDDPFDFAALLRSALDAWQELGIRAGNWVLIPARNDEIGHTRMSLHPRVSGHAGFELATGWMINIIPTSRAVEELRPFFSASCPRR